jgi:uncharacterized protein (TIGR00369 family)
MSRAAEWDELIRRTTERSAPVGVLPQGATDRPAIALFEAMIAGELPPPPITRPLGFILTSVAIGRAVFHGRVSRDFYNPLGTVHGGWISTLLDSCMACAVHTTLAAKQAYTSVEIKINFVRPVLESTGPVQAEGTVLNVGRRVGTAEGKLTDAAGRLLAHGTTTCLIFPAEAAA